MTIAELLEPKIEEIALRLRFTAYLAQPQRIQTGQQGAQVDPATEQVIEQVRRLLAILKDKERGSKEAMLALGLNHRPTFLYDYLHPSLSGGLVEMTQPDSPKSPTQKYRLTEKGKNVLEGGA